MTRVMGRALWLSVAVAIVVGLLGSGSAEAATFYTVWQTVEWHSDWPTSGEFYGFNPSWGTLTALELTWHSQVHGKIHVGTSAPVAPPGTATVVNTSYFTLPGMAQQMQGSYTFSYPELYLAGMCEDFANFEEYGGGTYSGLGLSQYLVGSGTVIPSGAILGVDFLPLPPSVGAWMSPMAQYSLTLDLRYEFEADLERIPEPSTLALLAAAAVVGLVGRRLRRND